MKSLFFLLPLCVATNIAESKTKIPSDISRLNQLEQCKVVNNLSIERKYFYKVEKSEFATVVYLSSGFYSLKYDQRELVAACVFIVSKAEHPETKAVTFNDDMSGQFLGIFTPEKGLTLGR